MNNFYVYQHRRLDTGEVFYVGKGYNKRAFSKHSRSSHWYNIVNKSDYKVEFVDINLDEETAFELEIFTIEFYGRKDLGLGTLINLTDGGDGVSNPSKEIRIKIGNANRGKTLSTEIKEKMSIAQSNKSEEYRNKISKSLKGRKLTKEHIENRTISQKNMNKKPIINCRGEIFESSKDAGSILNIGEGNISNCCRGNTKYAGKYSDGEPIQWMKLEEYTSGKTFNTYINIKCKPIINCRGDIFESIKSASEALNIKSSSISACCRGLTKYSGKYSNGDKIKWKYYIREGGL